MEARETNAEDAVRTPDATPFFLPGGRRGVLLLHGLGGSPHAMRYLGRRLNAAGFTVRCDVLPGHDADPEALAAVPWTRWYGQAEAGLRAVREHIGGARAGDGDGSGAGAIGVVGLSMGAALAVRLCAQYGPANVRCAALLAPAFRLPFGAETGVALATRLGLHRLLPMVPRPRGGDVADREARAANPTRAMLPVHAAGELVRLMAAARRDLAQVSQPLLVMHSHRDHTIPFRSAAWVGRHARAPVRLIALRDSYHLITIDRDRARVATEVASFLAENLGPAEETSS